MADLIERESVIKAIAERQDKATTGTEDCALHTAIKIVRDAPAFNRWIPCSDKLPEIFEHVMIVYLDFAGKKNITIAYRDDEENACDWCSDWDGEVIDAKVTHWMPLPELPESGV